MYLCVFDHFYFLTMPVYLIYAVNKLYHCFSCVGWCGCQPNYNYVWKKVPNVIIIQFWCISNCKCLLVRKHMTLSKQNLASKCILRCSRVCLISMNGKWNYIWVHYKAFITFPPILRWTVLMISFRLNEIHIFGDSLMDFRKNKHIQFS